jgi:aspartyl/asparaginyl-tRNA synthetase
VRDLRSHLGQEVTVYGWVNTLRLQRTIQFVLVRDHTGMVQITHKRPDPEGEHALSALVAERHGHPFVFVTDFPVSVRPFYHLRTPDNPDLTASFDLLWNGIEITAGT